MNDYPKPGDMVYPKPGDLVTCAETGKSFTVQRNGCTYNYARSSNGEIISDEGVDIRERRYLTENAPFVGYISSDGKHLTGWKGNILGDVFPVSRVRLSRLSFTHGSYMTAYRIRDVHGQWWHGRGSPGIAIVIRRMKEPRK